MRQLYSRIFDLAVGVAVAMLLIGSAVGDEPVRPAEAEMPPDDAIEISDPVALPVVVDAKAELLAELVTRGRHWRIDTERGPVHVWVPPGYAAETAQTVVYVHGYWQDADTVWAEHRLPEQFALSGINAMFVVPEAPRGKYDKVLWPTARAVLADVASQVDADLPKGRLAVLGHSGAYRTVIDWLDDPRIDTVVLLDAAYVEVRPYRDWVVRSKKRRLINVAIDTIRWSNYLHRWLPGTVTVQAFPREITDEIRKARILYVKSDITHWHLVTQGVAVPAILRALGAPSVLEGELPALGLPMTTTSAFAQLTE